MRVVLAALITLAAAAPAWADDWKTVTKDVPDGAARIAAAGDSLVIAACGETDECTASRSTDNGATWTQIGEPAPIDSVRTLAVIGTAILVETDSHAVWAQVSGTTWTKLSVGGKDAAFLASDDTYVYTTAGGKLFSTKDVATWVASFSKLPAIKITSLAAGGGGALVEARTGQNTGKVQHLAGGKSTDAGKGVLACAAGDRIVMVDSKTTLRASHDGAKTWTKITAKGGITSVPIACAPDVDGEGVLILLDDTVFRLADTASTLEPSGTGASGSSLSIALFHGHEFLLASDGDITHLYTR